MKKKSIDVNVSEEKIEQKKKESERSIRWERLDNTAHLFPVIAGESMTNVYRISVTLNELIQPDLLQVALDMILPKFDGFNLRLQTGVFWYYFEENGKPAPTVKPETKFPCRFIKGSRNRSYLFRVTYYKYRINLEAFHALTDGMGGINFLNELTYQYLRLAHPDLIGFVGDRKTYERHMRRLCRSAKGTNTPLEINFLGISEKRRYPNPVFWEIAAEEGCKVVLGIDAHCPEHVLNINAEEEAMELVRRYGLNLLEAMPLKNF